MLVGLQQGGVVWAAVHSQWRPGLHACPRAWPSTTVWKSFSSQQRKQSYLFQVQLNTQKISSWSHAYSYPVLCSVQALQKITFHTAETSVTVPFSKEAAVALGNAIRTLLQTFQEKKMTTKPQRWPNMEFQHSPDNGILVEFFCNPNAYAHSHQAKVLMTINSEKIKIMSEGQLSAIKSDVDQFMEMCA